MIFCWCQMWDVTLKSTISNTGFGETKGGEVPFGFMGMEFEHVSRAYSGNTVFYYCYALKPADN